MNGDLADLFISRLDGIEATLDRHTAEQGRLDSEIKAVGRALATFLRKQQNRDQPDWIAVQNPKEARRLLQAAVAWHDSHLSHLGGELAGCWPWHPFVVVQMIGLARQHRTSYAAGEEAVSVFLTRYLPALHNRMKGEVNKCEPVHKTPAGFWSVDVERLGDLAEWWATSRQGTPPGLTPRT